MDYKQNVIKIFIIGFIFITFLSISSCIHKNNQIKNSEDINKECLQATIKAINLEIERFQEWLKMPEKNLSQGALSKKDIKYKLDKLKADLIKYKNLKIKNYKCPKKKEVIGWIEQPYKENILLYTKNMSRSGPFYHILGIHDNNFIFIKPNIKYKMKIYLIYPRFYPFPSYYIFIERFKPIAN